MPASFIHCPETKCQRKFKSWLISGSICHTRVRVHFELIIIIIIITIILIIINVFIAITVIIMAELVDTEMPGPGSILWFTAFKTTFALDVNTALMTRILMIDTYANANINGPIYY